MVKRYNPTASIEYGSHDDEYVEAIPSMVHDDHGQFVKLHAYTSLEKQYNKLVYGKDCVRIANRANLSCENVHQQVKTYCNEYIAIHDNFPNGMTIANMNISFQTMMNIFSHLVKKS